MLWTKAHIRFTCTYILILLIVFVSIIPTCTLSLDSARNAEKANHVASMRTGCAKLEENLLKYNYIANQLMKNRNLRILLRRQGKLSPAEQLLALNIQKELKEKLTLISLHSFAILSFQNTDIIIDPNRIHFSLNRFYGDFFLVESIDCKSWFEDILFDDTAGILPTASISIEKQTPEQFITYKIILQEYKNNKVVLLIFINVDDLLDLLIQPGILPDASLAIYNRNEDILLYNYNPNNTDEPNIVSKKGQKHDVVLDRIPLFGLNVALGIPQSIYQLSLRNIRQTQLLCLGIMFILGFVMSVWFAFQHVKPLKRMALRLSGNCSEEKNIYRYIDNAIQGLNMTVEQFSERIKNMKRELQHNDFERNIQGCPIVSNSSFR